MIILTLLKYKEMDSPRCEKWPSHKARRYSLLHPSATAYQFWTTACVLLAKHCCWPCNKWVFFNSFLKRQSPPLRVRYDLPPLWDLQRNRGVTSQLKHQARCYSYVSVWNIFPTKLCFFKTKRPGWRPLCNKLSWYITRIPINIQFQWNQSVQQTRC